MLRTSQRTSDLDEELVYERVSFVLAREDTPYELIKSEQIKMSDSDEEPDRERVNFVRALVEPEAELIKLRDFRPMKSEQVNSEIVTNHTAETSNAKAVAGREES